MTREEKYNERIIEKAKRFVKEIELIELERVFEVTQEKYKRINNLFEEFIPFVFLYDEFDEEDRGIAKESLNDYMANYNENQKVDFICKYYERKFDTLEDLIKKTEENIEDNKIPYEES